MPGDADEDGSAPWAGSKTLDAPRIWFRLIWFREFASAESVVANLQAQESVVANWESVVANLESVAEWAMSELLSHKYSPVVASGVQEVVVDALQNAVQLSELYSYIPDAAAGGLNGLTNSGFVKALVELSDGERLRVAGASVLGWIYLTARPGVLKGALDTCVAAPVQALTESVLGRRGWKRTDFVISEHPYFLLGGDHASKIISKVTFSW